jgi:GT2 family glycosyltransferase
VTAGVGVVVLDLDQQELTGRCLRSLAAGTSRPDFVVLLENGHQSVVLDGESQRCAKATPVVLRPSLNLRCAGGRNLGLNYLFRNTDVETMVALDNDTVVPPDFVEALAASPPQPLDVVAPVVFDLATGEVWSSGGTIGRDGDARQLDDLPRQGQPRQVDWAPGACLAMHRDTWAAVGEFDPWIEFLFDDIEWCHRVKQVGGRVLIRPELRIDHEPHQSLGGRWSPERVRYWSRNGTLFRVTVAKTRLRPTARWLAGQSLLSVRDLLTGRVRWSVARVAGLVEGLIEARRRATAPSEAR